MGKGQTHPLIPAVGPYLDPLLGGRCADVSISPLEIAPAEGDARVRCGFRNALRGLGEFASNARSSRAESVITAELAALGLKVYTDKTDGRARLHAHCAFARPSAGLECFSYSHVLGGPRIEVMRWLTVTPRALADCLRLHSAGTISDVHSELKMLVVSVGPLANLAVKQGWQSVGIPTSGGLFTGRFERPSGLVLDSYITPARGRDVYGPWSGLWESFPLDGDATPSDAVEDALDYRESRLLPFLRIGSALLPVVAPILGARRPGTAGKSWGHVYPALEETEFVDPRWFKRTLEEPPPEPSGHDIGCCGEPAA
jgi:hypothetical protein